MYSFKYPMISERFIIICIVQVSNHITIVATVPLYTLQISFTCEQSLCVFTCHGLFGLIWLEKPFSHEIVRRCGVLEARACPWIELLSEHILLYPLIPCGMPCEIPSAWWNFPVCIPVYVWWDLARVLYGIWEQNLRWTSQVDCIFNFSSAQ